MPPDGEDDDEEKKTFKKSYILHNIKNNVKQIKYFRRDIFIKYTKQVTK